VIRIVPDAVRELLAASKRALGASSDNEKAAKREKTMAFTGIGAGLAALAFWGFLAAVVVAGIWYDQRKRESQQETLRRMFESGRDLRPDVVDRMLALSDENKRPDRDFKIAALWILPTAPGLFLLGLVLGAIAPEARTALTGVSILALCLGVGFWFASGVAARIYGLRPSR
jgi:hypothetical protein